MADSRTCAWNMPRLQQYTYQAAISDETLGRQLDNGVQAMLEGIARTN